MARIWRLVPLRYWAVFAGDNSWRTVFTGKTARFVQIRHNGPVQQPEPCQPSVGCRVPVVEQVSQNASHFAFSTGSCSRTEDFEQL
jgi:hypothetical protein